MAETNVPTQSSATELQRSAVAYGPSGVVLRNMDDLWRFASAVVNSGIAPKGMNVAGLMIAVEMGAELGLPPMASIQNIAVINGRPSIWGDAMLAICRQSNVFDGSVFKEAVREVEGRGMTGFCTVARKGEPPITHSFSMQDAERAHLLNKDTPWKTYPQRMVVMRARSWALRDAFPDLLRGMRAAEEEMDCAPISDSDVPRTLGDLTEKLTAEPEPEPEKPSEPPADVAVSDDSADRFQLCQEFENEFDRLAGLGAEDAIQKLWEQVLAAVAGGRLTKTNHDALLEVALKAKETAAAAAKK